MSDILRSFKTGARQNLVWIDYDAYAHKVFASRSPDWLRDPVRRTGALEQAQKVVVSDVLSIDLLAPFLAARPLSGGGPSEIAALLSLPEPRQYLSTLLDALGHRLATRLDVVALVPSPRDALIAAGAPADVAPDFNDLDDVGMALADLARALSMKSVHGLMMTVSDPASLGADEAEAAGSLISAVRHFGWSAVVASPSRAWPPAESLHDALDADLFLYPEASIAAVAKEAETDRRIGGGLGERFWSGVQPVPAEGAAAAIYGAVPADLEPERVLARLATIAPLRA